MNGSHSKRQNTQCNTENYVPVVVPGLTTGPSSSSTSTSSTSVPQDSLRDDSLQCPANTRSRRKRSRAQGDQLRDSRTKKIEDIDGARRSPVRELPEELEEFDDNLVDEEASASREAPASISREPLHQEPPINVVSGKHSIFIHFPKDRICEVCKRT